MTPLWFWDLPKRDMGVWAPVYRWYDHWYGPFGEPVGQPISWVMIG